MSSNPVRTDVMAMRGAERLARRYGMMRQIGRMGAARPERPDHVAALANARSGG